MGELTEHGQQTMAQAYKEYVEALEKDVKRLLEAIPRCHWARDAEFMFSPCTKGSIPIPEDEWVYCPWCGGVIQYEEE